MTTQIVVPVVQVVVYYIWTTTGTTMTTQIVVLVVQVIVYYIWTTTETTMATQIVVLVVQVVVSIFEGNSRELFCRQRVQQTIYLQIGVSVDKSSVWADLHFAFRCCIFAQQVQIGPSRRAFFVVYKAVIRFGRQEKQSPKP